MLHMTYVRPDRVIRTAVLEPTAEGYQPVRAAQAVANQFTRIYGPTVYANKTVATSQGPMTVVAAEQAKSAEQAVTSMAKSFANGESVRISDAQGRVAVVHPAGQKAPFWTRAVEQARALAQRLRAKAQLGEVGPGEIPVAYGYAPRFNRSAQAANTIMQGADQPPQGLYLPAQAGAARAVPDQLTAEYLARTIPGGVPAMVNVRGQANALDWFKRTGRYY